MGEHRIRLAGPWRFRQMGLAGTERGERLPVVGIGASETAEIRLERGFHAPSRLSADAELQLAVACSGAFVVCLNGAILPEVADWTGKLGDGEQRFGVQRGTLKSFNELEFAPLAGEGEEWCLEAVWLVICETNG